MRVPIVGSPRGGGLPLQGVLTISRDSTNDSTNDSVQVSDGKVRFSSVQGYIS